MDGLFGPIPDEVLEEIRLRVKLADELSTRLEKTRDRFGTLPRYVPSELAIIELTMGPYRRIADRGLVNADDQLELGVVLLIRDQLMEAQPSVERRDG